MRRPAVLVGLVGLALAGCGGSSATSSTSTATSSTGTAASATTTSTTSPMPTTPTSAGSTTSTTTTTTTAASDTNVRLAATFTIRPGGTLFPPAVAAPKHTTIVLTVRSQDSGRHTLALATPHSYTVSVAPGGSARLVLKGLADATYAVRVDGAVRGRLIVGAAPGP